ncbi:hypothetical protein [Streptomyces sp. NPDC048442]|uniref:hypothetical protein n=1 Tax=Streptomyces sp. NPDC048442 TaxID=3154823 RepID=UPI00341478CE
MQDVLQLHAASRRHRRTGKGVSQSFAAVADGVRYVRGHRLLVGLLLIDAASVSPALGNAGLGFLAELTTARTAVITGGLVCVAATLAVAAALPALRRATLAEPSRETAAADTARSTR